jgi:serine/threonine protein kinase/Tfp pilus assembly protein PilF
LTVGARVGAFQIEVPLGAGGMGEVYRARDTRLDRAVAIKALPAAFAGDPERLARFEREARLLASLEHPHIARIYGLEDVAGTPYLVLEFVEGETMERRLARGALSVREVLEVCGQIAAGVEAAHERGIVHRDLKPGNVMLSPSQGAKVLDFGLAKGDPGPSASGLDLSATPTIGLSATAQGLVLGTAPYMSPEQARGHAVDRRTDVWAFGCVLYECLTGRRAFAGETVSDVVARILEREPDWAALPDAVPARLREVVKRCLIKDARERPRDIGDLRRELSAIAQELGAPDGSRRAASDARPSLAVLYFENLASDAESEYFCAGITEDILTDLSKIKGLRVASRNAVLRYRGAPADIPRVAADLGVGAVLEGSVRRAGDRVRISAQLINAADGFHLWAERYDRTLQDVFAVQEEIASSIAKALQVALSPAESRALVKDRPSDARAYDLYLKGRQEYGRYTDGSLRAALDLFRQATEVDPGYALAWAGLADAHAQRVAWAYSGDPAESLRLGLEAARRAIELNPRLPEAHKAESLVLRYLGEEERAVAALRRALEIDPRFVPALTNLAVYSVVHADLAGGERLFRRALESDSEYPFTVTWLGFLFIPTGRFVEALEITDRIRKLSDEPFYVTSTHILRAMVHLRRGDPAAAERTVREGLADGADAANVRTIEAAVAVRSGRPDEARAILAELEHASGLGAGSMLLLAEAAVRLGEVDRAKKLLGRRVLGDLAAAFVRLDPVLHPLLDLPPFAPRRAEQTLIWPLEAPMMDPRVHAVFREVRIESGMPPASGVSGSRS